MCASSYSTDVSEGSGGLGPLTAGIVSATDADCGDNARIRYRIVRENTLYTCSHCETALFFCTCYPLVIALALYALSLCI